MFLSVLIEISTVVAVELTRMCFDILLLDFACPFLCLLIGGGKEKGRLVKLSP
jgi:hypothetical protein